MIVLTGRVVDVTKRQAGAPGNEWTEDVVHVLDGRRVIDVKAGRDFGSLPAIGEDVALNVWLRPYVTKAGAAGVGFTATGRVDVDAETGTPLRAVAG
jgi:hypothetical protein